MREIRGSGIAMSFQDPMTFLNPVFTIGDQIAEAIMLHNEIEKKDALEKAIEYILIFSSAVNLILLAFVVRDSASLVN